jgi:hypothetical protein
MGPTAKLTLLTGRWTHYDCAYLRHTGAIDHEGLEREREKLDEGRTST